MSDVVHVGSTHLGIVGGVGQCQVANYCYMVTHVHIIINGHLQQPHQQLLQLLLTC
jgi:hypothetical protein